jgi:hypothetical protein
MQTQTYTPSRAYIPFNKSPNKQYKPKEVLHNLFPNKTRTLKAQETLEAILALLQFEASKVGLATKASILTHNILKRNYLQRRS